MIFRDDLGGGHDGGRQVGDVALQADQGLGAGQAGLVENAVPGVGLDEAGGFDSAFAVDHLAGAGLLGVEGLLVAAGPFAGSSKLTGQLRGCESDAGPLGAGAVEAYPAH